MSLHAHGSAVPVRGVGNAHPAMAWQQAPLLDRIAASLVSLTPSEQRVGRLCLENPRIFASLPVSELAGRARVSNPTVVRFCRSVGYNGLTDFKSKLTGTAQEGVPFIHPHVDADDKPGDILVKVIDSTVSAFLKHRHQALAITLDKAVSALSAASQAQGQIQFFGIGDSGTVAQDAQLKFFHLGVRTNSYADGHLQVMGASVLGPGDCAVLISNSGRTRELMDSCDIARKNGATTIVMTPSGSPLASAGHIHIPIDHGLDLDQFSPMLSRLLHLMVIDVLVIGVALQLGGEAQQQRMQDIKHHLRHKRYD